MHKYNCFVIITATMLLLLIIITFLFICTSFILFIVHTTFICYAKVFICPFTYSASVYCFRFERASERIEETLAWAHTAHRHGLSFCFYPNYGMWLFIVRDAFLTKNWRSLMKRKKERRNTQKVNAVAILPVIYTHICFVFASLSQTFTRWMRSVHSTYHFIVCVGLVHDLINFIWIERLQHAIHYLIHILSFYR